MYVRSKLNILGYATEQSCSGHIKDTVNTAFVKFVEEYVFDTLPTGWTLQGVFLPHRCGLPVPLLFSRTYLYHLSELLLILFLYKKLLLLIYRINILFFSYICNTLWKEARLRVNVDLD